MLRIAAITAVVRKMSILLSPAQNSSVTLSAFFASRLSPESTQ
jgi:hypothetical protein